MRGTSQPVTKRQAKTPCTGAPSSSEFEIIAPLAAAAFVTAAMLYWLAA